MNFEHAHHAPNGFEPSHKVCEPYEDSVTSSAPSSQASIFSDTLSAQSSVASSISDDFRSGQEDARERDRICAQAQLRSQAHHNLLPAEEPSVIGTLLKGNAPRPSYADITSVPVSKRQHPRRSSSSRLSRPPPLIRQRDRKINFVDNLVDSATQMVEVIWPLSVVPCKSEAGSRGVLPLRTYIEETLRRSRTSYSTLQVALYYLVLIRPHVPKSDFTMVQTLECPADRALMCGRRMFLAALILASKYLQDRNYSAKAWSKMSGLKVCEINTNERIFLAKINWKLHISKPTFERWQEIVLRYTPNPPSSPDSEMSLATSIWKRMVPLLTPELKEVAVEGISSLPDDSVTGYGFPSPSTPTPTSAPQQSLHATRLETSSAESTPTPGTYLPRFLEPQPNVQPPTPALARLGPLPTPIMTPSSIAAPNTPAASVCGSRRPSICTAWAMVQKNSIDRCAIDMCYPNLESRPPLSRRPSVMSIQSSGSSPESMISDYSRSSRASSIASFSGSSKLSSMAPRACLARQATCRNAGLPSLKLVKEEKEGSATKPIMVDDDIEMTSSPLMADFSVSEKVLHAPHRHSKTAKHMTQPTAVSSFSGEKSRKRGRTHGQRRSDLQDEVRWQLEESLEDDMDLDDTVSSPSSAASGASHSLTCGQHIMSEKEAQLPAMHSRRASTRVPVEKNEGRKRTCCSARAMSISPVSLYGEVIDV